MFTALTSSYIPCGCTQLLPFCSLSLPLVFHPHWNCAANNWFTTANRLQLRRNRRTEEGGGVIHYHLITLWHGAADQSVSWKISQTRQIFIEFILLLYFSLYCLIKQSSSLEIVGVVCKGIHPNRYIVMMTTSRMISIQIHLRKDCCSITITLILHQISHWFSSSLFLQMTPDHNNRSLNNNSQPWDGGNLGTSRLQTTVDRHNRSVTEIIDYLQPEDPIPATSHENGGIPSTMNAAVAARTPLCSTIKREEETAAAAEGGVAADFPFFPGAFYPGQW